MQKDNQKILAIIAGTITLVSGAITFAYFGFQYGELNISYFASLGTIFLVVIVMLFFAFARYKDVKKGIPLEDERSRRVTRSAAATSFYFSLYWLLAISLFDNIFADIIGQDKLGASQAIGLAILGMTLVFLASWFWINRKADL